MDVVIIMGLSLITSAKKLMFSPGFLCPSGCLFVNKITQNLMDGF